MCLAVPGRVLEIEADDPLMRFARVDFGGVVKRISLVYTPEAQVGAYVLVHVGFAIAVIDEAQAERVFDDLHDIDRMDEPRSGEAG